MNKKSKQYKAVFSARIDFEYDESHQKTLHPDEIYCLDKSSNLEVSYNDIAKEAVWIINNDLKLELQKYTSISIKEVEVQAIYEGNIEIMYSVVPDLVRGTARKMQINAKK